MASAMNPPVLQTKVRLKETPGEPIKRPRQEDMLPAFSQDGEARQPSIKKNRTNSMQPDLNRPKQVGVYLETMDKRRLLVTTVAKKLHDNKVPCNFIYSKSSSQLLVLFSTLIEANKLINHATILDTLRCTAKLQDLKTKQKGVIRGIDADISEQELYDELTRDPHNQIQIVTRMMKNETDDTGNVNKVPTALVILEFTGNSLQRKVYMQARTG